MQNFTLGKKGISMLFFAFILLIGSSPTFGQENCPTVDDEDQDFCYLATVSDLEATANGDTVRWYRSATSTNPIPGDELLEDGSYFAGNESGTCDSRVEVTVTVTDAGPPDPLFGNIFAPCVYAEEPDNGGADTNNDKTVQDLINNIDGTNVQIFEEEFDETPLTEDTRLIRGESYFAGQESSDDCSTSSRVAIRYNPVYAPAPTAEPSQAFCEGATVGDLQSETTVDDDMFQGFRWYSTETSDPALDSSTPLVDGETYYVSQIVNRSDRNEPPCESVDRFAVTVTVNEIPDAPEADAEQFFCEDDAPTVADLEATGDNLTWYEDADLTTEATSTDPLQNGDTFYVTQTVNDCESEATQVDVTVDPTPVAPDADDQTLCQGQTVGELEVTGDNITFYSDEALTTVVDPSEEAVSGVYYATQQTDNSGCESPAVSIDVTVNPTPDAPTADAEQEFCPGDGHTVAFLEPSGNEFTWYTDAGLTNEADQNAVLTDGAVYYVTETNTFGCESDATEVTAVSETDAPVAEEEQIFCDAENATVADLQADGENLTWYEDAELNDPANDNDALVDGEDYFVTQTVDDCESEATQVTVTIEETPDAPTTTEPEQQLCEGQTVGEIDVTGENITFYSDEDLNNAVDASVEAEATTYYATQTNTAGCESDAVAITVTLNATPEAGDDNTSTQFCGTSEADDIFASAESVEDFYRDLLSDDAEDGGSFDPSFSELAAAYSENNFQTFTTTYTVTNDAGCEDEAVLSVTVVEQEDAEAGEIADQEICTDDSPLDLNTLLSDDATPGGVFSDESGEIENGIFDPSNYDAGVYEITYSVDEEAFCVTPGTSDSTTFNIEVFESPNAGDGFEMTMCITEVLGLDEAEATELFNDLLAEQGDFDEDGTFSPDEDELGQQIIAYLLNPNRPASQTFTTTYTVSSENCGDDSAVYSLTIQDVQEAEAGTIDDLLVCAADSPFDLNNLLSEDATPGGTFSDESGDVITDGIFDPSNYTGDEEITYFVDDSGFCVVPGTEDEETFTITVEEVPFTGEINLSFCITEVEDAISDQDEAAAFVTAILNDAGIDPVDLSRFGTGDLAEAERLADFINDPDADSETFNFTYSEEGDACDDGLAEISITINDLQDAEAGTIENQVVCSNEDPFDLNSLLSANATTGGTFTDESGDVITDGIFDPSDYTGDEEITYFVDDAEGDCVTEGTEDSTTFTITVVEPVDANAGDDVAVSYCASQDEDIQLISLLDDDANTFGSFSAPYEDGTFNPSVAGAGEVVITYTVDGAEDCAIGSDTATITITVDETPDAPAADAEQSFCLVDDNTVADLTATGDNVVWYEDAGLTTEATSTDALIDNATYYAVAVSDNGCESDPTEVTVTIQDAAAPTLQADGEEFCRGDNPTVQDLVDNINGDNIQIYETSTGGSPIATTTALENGATYYATATDPSIECESSERLSVTVDVAFCGIPEGFSPNDDNINDRFVIPDIATDFPNYSIEIYNRWGNLVFEGNSSTGDWDGTNNQSTTMGEGVLPAGVYFYILNYNDGQTSPVQGKVYLSR